MESAIEHLEESVSICGFSFLRERLFAIRTTSMLSVREVSSVVCVEFTLSFRATGAESRRKAGHDRVADRRIREGFRGPGRRGRSSLSCFYQ